MPKRAGAAVVFSERGSNNRRVIDLEKARGEKMES